jgi:hypothetical protein
METLIKNDTAETLKNKIETFFNHYEDRMNKALRGETPDIDDVTQSFADCFIEASPLGVICGKNDAEFKKQIPKGYEMYKSIGIGSMNILSTEIILLNQLHIMANVNWRSNYVKKDNSKGAIEFNVIYLLQEKDGKHKIFAYITEDEQKALKEHGLI